MQSEMETNIIVARLEDGEDLFPGLEELARKHGLRSGIILTGVGMLKDAEVGYFDGKSYEKTVLSEPHELVSMQGTIAILDDKPFFHVHVGLAGPDHGLVGGHLFKAKVKVTNEISILVFRDIEMNRVKNEATGLTDMKMIKASRATGTRMGKHGGASQPSMDLDTD